MLSKKTLNQLGSTIVEVILASGVVGIAMLAAAQIFNMETVLKRKHINKVALASIRTNLVQVLASNNAWIRTVASVDNAGSFACLANDLGSCNQTENPPFNIYTGDNVRYYEGINASKGFTADGAECTGFSATEGNDNCPFRYQLGWKPKDFNTAFATFTVTAKLLYKPSTKFAAIKTDDFNIELIQWIPNPWPAVSFASGTSLCNDDQPSCVIQAVLNKPTAYSVTVPVTFSGATIGVHFNASSTTITFPPNVTVASFVINPVNIGAGPNQDLNIEMQRPAYASRGIPSQHIMTLSRSRWVAGGWGACSVATCGAGTQTRTVTCESGGVSTPGMCSPSTQPASTQACSVACPPISGTFYLYVWTRTPDGLYSSLYDQGPWGPLVLHLTDAGGGNFTGGIEDQVGFGVSCHTIAGSATPGGAVTFTRGGCASYPIIGGGQIFNGTAILDGSGKWQFINGTFQHLDGSGFGPWRADQQ